MENYLKILKNIYIKDIKTIKMEEIKYIFKQKMLILFFENDKIIKIILYNENKKKIINIKFKFNYEVTYNEFQQFFKENNAQQIIYYLKSIKICDKKSYENYEMRLKGISYIVLFEE